MNTDDYNPDLPQDSSPTNSDDVSSDLPSLEITNGDKIKHDITDNQEDKPENITEITGEISATENTNIRQKTDSKKPPKLFRKKEKKPEALLMNPKMTQKASLSRHELLSAFFMFLCALLVIFLHLNSRQNWKKEMQRTQIRAELLLDSAQRISAQAQLQKQDDSLRIRAIKMNYFDAYDENHFRIYGLFRDKNRSFSEAEVAKKFNIASPNAIKKSEVGEEFWFIVPVKGVHFVKQGESSQSIAQKYYFDPKGAALIEAFNYQQIKAGKTIFIPFN